MRKLAHLGSVLGVIVLALPVQASTLLPGSTVTPVPKINVPTGTVVATATGNFTEFIGLNVAAKGTYAEEVVREAGGTLDFLYQITLTQGHINHVMGSSYAGFKITGFGYSQQTTAQLNASISGNILLGGASGAKPSKVGYGPNVTLVTQHLTKGQVDYLFPTPKLSSPTNTPSAVLVLQTNATGNAFEPGVLTLVNGSKQTFAALQPGPEPSSIVLLATGIVGLCGYAWRRHKV